MERGTLMPRTHEWTARAEVRIQCDVHRCDQILIKSFEGDLQVEFVDQYVLPSNYDNWWRSQRANGWLEVDQRYICPKHNPLIQIEE
jgi:hypothetical protein